MKNMKSNKNPVMKIVSVYTEGFSFSKSKEFKFEKNGKPDWPLEPKVTQSFEKLSDDIGKVTISVSIPGGDKFPFSLEATEAGIFELPGFEKSDKSLFLMRNNTLAIVYPYLRSLVSSVSSLGGFPPLILPAINTFSKFGDQTKENGEKTVIKKE